MLCVFASTYFSHKLILDLDRRLACATRLLLVKNLKGSANLPSLNLSKISLKNISDKVVLNLNLTGACRKLNRSLAEIEFKVESISEILSIPSWFCQIKSESIFVEKNLFKSCLTLSSGYLAFSSIKSSWVKLITACSIS
eukprot:NODE_507_length_6688_cov_1.276673.p6 type:complete len:140 gc:universal NODE_507_length_6688_cov_1.276673:3651-3232(-)